MSASLVYSFVKNFHVEHGKGPKRSDLATFLGYTQTRNLPGVRQAIADGYIRYDEDGRFIPLETRKL